VSRVGHAEHPDPGAWTANLAFHPTAFVAPGASIAGDVTLGARSSVWFHVAIRGDSAPVSVGDDSNVQDGSVVHVDHGFPARIGARVTIGHQAMIHGCTIGDDCLIGMSAIVLSGAVVEPGSLVAAGALVREGQHVPAGSLVVGAPARVVKPVSEAHRAAIENGSSHYVALSRSYLRRGFARPHPPREGDPGTSRVRGPMTALEWSQSLAVLADSPAWAERAVQRDAALAMRRPAPDRWSAHEVVAHLRDSDRDVFQSRLERHLAESEPWFDWVDVAAAERVARWAKESPASVLEEWKAVRAALVARLERLVPSDWDRLAFHSLRGPMPLAWTVRIWVDHDLGHRGQLARALAGA